MKWQSYRIFPSPVRAIDSHCCMGNNKSGFVRMGPPSQASLPSASAARFHSGSSNRMFRPSSNLQDAFGTVIRAVWGDECGQGVSEYAIVMSMVVLLALVGLSFISSQVLDTLRRVVAALQ